MNIRRILVVLGLSTVFYFFWQIGFDYIWAYILKAGISTITAIFADIQQVVVQQSDDAIRLFFHYPDRNNSVNVEYALPIVLLLAWQTYLYIDKNVTIKFANHSLLLNISIFYLLQIFFPLLLYNVSASKTKATLFFLGLQVFGMLVLFLIIKDSVMIKYNSRLKKVTNRSSTK